MWPNEVALSWRKNNELKNKPFLLFVFRKMKITKKKKAWRFLADFIKSVLSYYSLKSYVTLKRMLGK